MNNISSAGQSNVGSNMNVLPNIENFFVLNEKVLLVDSEKCLWHLKKCKKYEDFTLNNKHIYSNKEDNFNAFLEYYQNLSKNKKHLSKPKEGEKGEYSEPVDENISKISEISISANEMKIDSNKNIEEKDKEKDKDTSFLLSDSN
jgi:hypothetical protein